MRKVKDGFHFLREARCRSLMRQGETCKHIFPARRYCLLKGTISQPPSYSSFGTFFSLLFLYSRPLSRICLHFSSPRYGWLLGVEQKFRRHPRDDCTTFRLSGKEWDTELESTSIPLLRQVLCRVYRALCTENVNIPSKSVNK